MPDTPLTPKRLSTPDIALNIAQVLWEERIALVGRPLPSGALDDPDRHIAELDKDFADLGAGDLPATYRLLRKDNRWALCLSGGGIRSAAFALGIMQRLAEYYAPAKWNAEKSEPLLQQFDYLSTVSGGGYVGSWFSAWLLQEGAARR